MIPILWTAAAAAAAAGTFWLVIIWSRSYEADLRASSDFLDEYYRNAQKLIRDPETPDSVVRFIEFLAPRAGDPALARSLAWHVVTGRITNDGRAKSKLSRELDQLRPELKDTFAQMITSGCLASAAADPVFSSAYRMMLAIVLSQSGHENDAPSVERARAVAVDLARACPEPVAA